MNQPRLFQEHEDLPLFTVPDAPAPPPAFPIRKEIHHMKLLQQWQSNVNQAKAHTEYAHRAASLLRTQRLAVYRELIQRHGVDAVLKHQPKIVAILDAAL